MNRNFLYFKLIAFVLMLTLGIGCETENIKTTNIDLLTNGSSKIWYLSKIVTIDSTTINPPTCIVDDEFNFKINGTCLINNMGTIYSQPPLFSEIPFCKDTIEIIDNASWTLNAEMDILTFSTAKYVIPGKILKLTNDTLILKRTYSTSVIQTEYYASKKQQ